MMHKHFHMLSIALLIATQLNAHETIPTPKPKDDYRDYSKAPLHVKEFYHQNHENQTLDFVLKKKQEFAPLNRTEMTLWQAVALLDTIKDESDPDLDRPQSYHAYQTAEALRKDGHPDWLVLTGFIHDLGKVLATFDQPQWAVVGDTYPVGCQFSEKIIFYDYFKNNPDKNDARYNTQYGIYSPQCGLDNVHMSWGHDEYLYYVVKNSGLPAEALFVIRYHSCYAFHRENDYQYLMNQQDLAMLPWLKLFQQYDLYSKSAEPLDIESIKPYYQELVNKYVPGTLKW